MGEGLSYSLSRGFSGGGSGANAGDKEKRV